MSYDRRDAELLAEIRQTPRQMAPVHPGEVLLLDFMEPFGLSQNALARALNVSPRRINEIVHGRRAVTAGTAYRLARFFGTSPEFWVNLQAQYDLQAAEDEAERADAEVTPLAELPQA